MDQADQLRALPSYGPDWDTAIAFGIDVALLLENLALTPAERMAQHQAFLDFLEHIGPPPEVPDATDR